MALDLCNKRNDVTLRQGLANTPPGKLGLKAKIGYFQCSTVGLPHHSPTLTLFFLRSLHGIALTFREIRPFPPHRLSRPSPSSVLFPVSTHAWSEFVWKMMQRLLEFCPDLIGRTAEKCEIVVTNSSVNSAHGLRSPQAPAPFPPYHSSSSAPRANTAVLLSAND